MFYTELMVATDTPFEALAIGEVEDMYGRTATFTKRIFRTIVKNTKEIIEKTKTESGEIVGLPIDEVAHNKGDAAGWIIDVNLSEDESKILVTPKWTNLGVEAITEGLRRWFSASIKPDLTVILGGTLTNWPAMRNLKTGAVTIKPIELSIKTKDYFLYNLTRQESNMSKKDEVVEDTTEVTELALEEAVKKVLEGMDIPDANIEEENEEDEEETSLNIELSNLGNLNEFSANLEAQVNSYIEKRVERMERQVNQLAKKRMFEMQRKKTISEFAQDVTSGTEAHPRGFPLGPDEIEAFLFSLTSQEHQDAAMSIFERIHQNGLVSYTAIGHGKKVEVNKALPMEYQVALDNGEMDIEDLNNPIIGADLGNLDTYDLSKWSNK